MWRLVKIGALLAALWFLDGALAGFGQGAHHAPLEAVRGMMPALVVAAFVGVLAFSGLRRLVGSAYTRLHPPGSLAEPVDAPEAAPVAAAAEHARAGVGP